LQIVLDLFHLSLNSVYNLLIYERIGFLVFIVYLAIVCWFRWWKLLATGYYDINKLAQLVDLQLVIEKLLAWSLLIHTVSSHSKVGVLERWVNICLKLLLDLHLLHVHVLELLHVLLQLLLLLKTIIMTKISNEEHKLLVHLLHKLEIMAFICNGVVHSYLWGATYLI